jgi:hypothetical protein
MRGICAAGEPAATDSAGAHAAASIPAAAHTAAATKPAPATETAPAAHASATTAATPGFGAVDSSSRKHGNRNRGCADMSEREH